MTPLFFVTNIGLGAGLAMDACAVSMSNGMTEPRMKVGKWLAIAGLFGLFQALMPIIGYFAGHAFIDYIGPYIPWIALALLSFLGGKMLFEGIRDEVKASKEKKAAFAPSQAQSAGKEPVAAPSADAGDGKEEIEQGAADKDAAPESEQGPGVSAETAGEDGAQSDATAKGTAPVAAANGEEKKKLTMRALLVQAVATSIDALSVGLTIADYTVVEAFVAALIIALVTFGICVLAVFIGKKFGDKLGNKAVILGGAILVAIGLEICLTGLLL